MDRKEANTYFDTLGGEDRTVKSGEFWPKGNSPGVMIVGTILNFEESGGKYDSPLVRIRMLDNRVCPVNMNESLRDQILPHDAGKHVAILYSDNLDTGKKQPMRIFRVKILDELPPADEADDLPF